MSEDNLNEKKSLAERLGLKSPREDEADRTSAWKSVHQPGIREVEQPKPVVDLGNALAKLGSMIDAPTAEETNLLIEAFKAGALEKYAPDRLRPIGEQDDYLRKLRMISNIIQFREGNKAQNEASTKRTEAFWAKWTADHGIEFPCHHTVNIHVVAEDLAWMSAKYGRPRLLCRTCGEYQDDPEFLKKVAERLFTVKTK